MKHLPTSLILLLIFCSLSAGKTFWTHLGTRCDEDCKIYWGEYMCKTTDKDGQCQTMYCSPRENMDYWGRQCSESSKCEKHGNDYYWCRIDFAHWGYCGMVTESKDYYGSYYGALCYNNCEPGKGNYYWCNTAKGWDYCSPSENTDYMNRQCKEDSPCGKYNADYNWCKVEGSWGYCGHVEPKMLVHRTYKNDVCIDECQYYESKGYYWCHTASHWDYCSPNVNVTYKGESCRSDHSCGLNGESYNWCWTSGSEYDYCGPIKPGECTYIPSEHRSRRAVKDDPQKNGRIVCKKVDKGNKITTTFTAVPAPRDFADGSQWRSEIENLISNWDNGHLVDQPTSNLLRSANIRIDMQNLIPRNNIRYYNMQVQRNVPREAGTSTTFSQVIVPPNVPARYIRRAFLESFRMQSRIFIDVSESRQC